MKWGNLLGFKTIFHCHGATIKEYFEKVGIANIQKTLSQYDCIVGISEYWHDYFANSLGFKDKAHTIYNIILPANIAPVNAFSNITNFLFLGQIGKRKGIFDVINAIHKHKLTGFKLIIGGDGDVETLKSIIKEYHLDNWVKYVGWVSGDMKKYLLNECDVLMLPSYNEGLPISILEALSYGKAIISTHVGGIPELVTNDYNGILVDPGNIDAIGYAMQTYIKDKRLAHLHGNNAHRKAESYYPDVIMQKMETLYRSLLKKQTILYQENTSR